MDKYPEEVYEDPNFCGTMKLCKYRNTWLMDFFCPDKEYLDRFLNVDIRPSDILLVSFSKSGTTWLQDIIWKVSCIKNPELVEREEVNGKKTTMEELILWLDGYPMDISKIDQLPSPRFLKFHNQYKVLPAAAQNGTAKIIYIARDVRDVAISFYHFMDFLSWTKYTGTAEDMCREFLKDTVYSGPWLDHVKDFWDRRHEPNILFLTYEDLKLKPAEEIRRLAEFLDVSITQSQIDDVIEATSFESMKKNDTANMSWLKKSGLANPNKEFMRKGVTGDWKNHISQELGDAMERKFLDPLRECGLVFGES